MGLSGVFPVVRLGLQVWGGRPQRSGALLHILSRVCPSTVICVHLDLDHVAEVVSIRFLHCRVALVGSPSHAVPWESPWCHNPHLRDGSDVPPPWDGNIDINLLAFFCVGNMSARLHSKRCTQLLIYIRLDSWIFTLCFVQICANDITLSIL